MSMIGRWLEQHGSELDALIAKIGKETGQLVTVEGVACHMLDQALDVLFTLPIMSYRLSTPFRT
jgi:hypothetical protein